MERGAYVRMLSAVYAAMFLIRVAFGIVVVTFARYVTEGDFVYSLVVTASPFFELITIVFAGFFTDRYGRKGVLLTGLGLGAISMYSLALTRHVLLLGLINVLHGIASALILVTTLAVIATHAPPEHRGREMGIFNLANIFGWISGFAVGSLLLDVFATRLEYTFVLAGFLATLGLLYANRMIQLPDGAGRAPSRSHLPTFRDLLASVSNPRVVLLTVPWFIVYLLEGPFITFAPRVTTDALRISGAATSLGVLAVGALLILSQVVWGRLSDRAGREGVMLVGALGFAALMGVIVYAFFTTQSADAQVVFAAVLKQGWLLLLLLFVALAFAPAGLAAIADEAKEGAQGTTMSAYSLTLSLGFIVGPPIVGAISQTWGGRGMVLYFAVLAGTLLAAVVTRFAQSRLRAPEGA